ncbi:glycosyltransferase family 4 protein [Roseibium salinum]|uniref:Glycosyltransferase family 4 protein n=1 Tax=Roseibium salinum TaxID=1604349 RepID=A0ABT3R106_9HYPH|nr:glycosyltransferase family 4 protein [Roseibium sp. DSM 29163]MCX2722845.1 glycosyltransferase family 4 protein [Roseibium sp. DSM 29163]
MRILVFAHNHPDLHPGGTETVACELARAYRKAGHEALFVAATNHLHREPHPGTSFQAISDSGDELLMWAGHFDRFNMSQIDLKAFVPDMQTLLESFRPDVVHIHHLLLFGVELPVLIRRVLPHVKIVMTLHDYYPICANDGVLMQTPDEPCAALGAGGLCRCIPEAKPNDLRLRERFIKTHFDAIDEFVAPSNFLRGVYVRWGLSADRIKLIRNGRPDAAPAPLRSAPGAPRNVFGFFGNLTPWKGIEVLLQAARILNEREVDFELRVHGGAPFQDPDFVERIERLFEETAPNVTRLGPYKTHDVPELMGPVDWVVVPSVWWENAPLVIAEAQQHGRPVITSGVGGMAEAVCHGVDGLHVRKNDPSGLAGVLAAAARDPQLHETLAANTRPPETVAAVAEQYLRLFAGQHAAAEEPAA